MLLLLSLPTLAQSRWKVIPTVGLQVTALPRFREASPLAGYKAGGMVRYQVRQGDLGRLGIESGLFLNDIGAVRSGAGDYRQPGIEIPLLFNFDINLTSRVNSYLRIGAYYRKDLSKDLGSVPGGIGFQVGCGAEYRNWVVSVDGLIGTHPLNVDGERRREKMAGTALTVGYSF